MVRAVIRESKFGYLGWILSMALLAASSCAAPVVQQSEHVRKLPLPKGAYDGLALLPDGSLVVALDVPRPPLGPGEPAGRLMRFEPSSGTTTVFQVGPMPTDCTTLDYRIPQLLPDGQLGFERICDPVGGTVLDVKYEYYSVGPSGRLRLLSSSVKAVAGQVTWSSDMSRAYADLNGGICSGFFPVSPTLTTNSERFFTAGGSKFLLNGGGSADACETQGRAAGPSFQRGTDRIAFMASPDSQNRRDFARLQVPWNLYESDSNFRGQRLRLANIIEPGYVEFGKQGSIYFAGKFSGIRGMWKLAPGRARPSLLFKGLVPYFALSQDETNVVVQHSLGDGKGDEFIAFRIAFGA